jgi:hypothetical protein
MKSFFEKLWTDETFFADSMLKFAKFAAGIVGALIEWNVIPTGIDGGSKYGLLGLVVAAVLPSRTQKVIQKIADPQQRVA